MNILITGAGSYVGTSVERWIKNHSNHRVDTLDMLKDTWRDTDFSIYDVVYHVAGIAHVNAKANMEALYYKVNRDLTINVYDGIAISSDDLSMLLANYIDSVPRPDFGRGVSSLVWRKDCMS